MHLTSSRTATLSLSRRSELTLSPLRRIGTTFTSELSNLGLIAQDKERELLSEREKTKKAEEESSMLKGIVDSLSSRMLEMERHLAEAENRVKQTEARAEVEAKGTVYQKFLAGTLSKEVTERRYDY